ncbi:MAG: response regulator, partial [Lachnospiraceae bacterium]|nr:response regulator [Lachnospiraceae bacterium]
MEQKKRGINKKYIEVDLKRTIIIYSFLVVFEVYLFVYNLLTDNNAVAYFALFCTVMTAIALTLLCICFYGKKPHKYMMHVAIINQCFVYWITFAWFLYSGGTGGTSIFLLFMAAPVCFYFFNLFYGSVFCFILVIGAAIYMWSPLRELGYAFPEIYYDRFPIMLLIETVICGLAQYEAIRAKILQDEALEEARVANASKTDFLANTSHEIRTPMNAILGFCELILREDSIDTKVREYSEGIKSAGHNLLYIINDILDISKIEAGKVEIIEDEFDLSSLITDVTSIAMARKLGKDLEIMVNADGNLPQRLFGDVGRIRQIVTNLMTNAIKYTKEGGIYLEFAVEKSEKPMFIVSVSDTGIGIAPENIDKIFRSFQQVDMKRNRAIEGTGLGLAISQHLARLMGGDITVESEYGKGSMFRLEVPVGLPTENTLVDRNAIRKLNPGFVVDMEYENERLQEFYDNSTSALCKQLGMMRLHLPADDKIPEEWDDLSHCLVDYKRYKERESFFLQVAKKRKLIVMTEQQEENAVADNVTLLYQPVHSVSAAVALLGAENVKKDEKAAGATYEFIAPGVRILIVDDNVVNLQVTTKLMEAYEMDVTTAQDGYLALEITEKEKFDLIFMDHMMPGIDGIETVKRLHENVTGCNAMTPVVALTANAISGMREMFLDNGFKDYLAKPINVGELERLLRKYLPADKVKRKGTYDAETMEFLPEGKKKEAEDEISPKARKIMEESELFDYKAAHTYRADMEILELYAEEYEANRDALSDFLKEKDWKNYDIRVHALKSTSRMIGATVLGDLAAEAEQAAKAGEGEKV